MSNYTDKQLLELAAKAANYKIRWRDMKGGYERTLGTPKLDSKWWNPLTDDGDALRLAVNLHLEIAPACYSKDLVDVYSKDDNPVTEFFNGDPYAATRRAIVRAAAAIGEKL